MINDIENDNDMKVPSSSMTSSFARNRGGSLRDPVLFPKVGNRERLTGVGVPAASPGGGSLLLLLLLVVLVWGGCMLPCFVSWAIQDTLTSSKLNVKVFVVSEEEEEDDKEEEEEEEAVGM